MASYRGSQYIGDQIESIIKQLGPDDELIIVDDASPDNTVDIIRTFADPRIRLIQSPANQGYVKSFEQAAMASRGRYVLLTDQDDVWLPGRITALITALQSASVAASNFDVLGGGPRPNIPRLQSRDSARHAANLAGIMVGYRAYYGCGMGFRREMLPVFTPVPSYLRESHDLWLAICGNVAKSIAHLDEATLLRRIHDDNATPRTWRSLPVILRSRLMLLKCLFEARRRLKGASLGSRA